MVYNFFYNFFLLLVGKFKYVIYRRVIEVKENKEIGKKKFLVFLENWV